MESILDGLALNIYLSSQRPEDLTGEPLAILVSRILQDPGVYVFGELIALPGFKTLPEQLAKTVELFAYGTIEDYQPSIHGSLTDAQITKLKKLSIISLVLRSGAVSVSYEVLAAAAKVSVDPKLDDLLIECIYDGILVGKLDPENRQLCVQSSMARDINPQTDIAALIEKLQSWSNEATAVQNLIRITAETAKLS